MYRASARLALISARLAGANSLVSRTGVDTHGSLKYWALQGGRRGGHWFAGAPSSRPSGWRSGEAQELEVPFVLVEAVVVDLVGGETHHVVALSTIDGVHLQTGVLVAVTDHPAAVRRHR